MDAYDWLWMFNAYQTLLLIASAVVIVALAYRDSCKSRVIAHYERRHGVMRVIVREVRRLRRFNESMNSASL